MPNSNVQFEGQTLVIPGAYYSDDVSATIPVNPSLVPPLVFIAYGYGGKPFTPITFPNGGGQPLLKALRGAPCSDFVQFIANPSTELFGASQITYINCSTNTQSSLVLKDGSNASLITLTSADYGPPSNLLEAQVTAGSLGGIELTLFDQYTGTTQQVADNLGVPFQIAYLGAASGVTLSVTAVSGVATYNSTAGGGTTIPPGTGANTLTITSSGANESVSLPLGSAQFATVGQVVEYLNTTGHYTAEVLPNISNGTMPTALLDSVSSTALPLPSGGNPNYVNVTAGVGAVIYWVNQFANSMATASATIGVAEDAPAVIPLTHFSGATAGPPTTGNYATAFNVAATVPAWVVITDTNSPAVVALGVQHAYDMGIPGTNRWRRFVTGSSVGDTVTQTETNARGMNGKESTYVYPGLYRTDAITGQNTLFGGLHAAAAVASMMAGNIIAQPLTAQVLSGNGPELVLTTGAGGQIDELQQAGVMVLYANPVSALPTIVSDFTTWQNDNNPENVFNQQVACRWGLAYALSQSLQQYIGTIAAPFGLQRIKNAAIAVLNQLIWSPGNNGILTAWDAKSLQITYTGASQAVNLQVNVTFVGQVRFVLELAFVQPLNLVG